MKVSIHFFTPFKTNTAYFVLVPHSRLWQNKNVPDQQFVSNSAVYLCLHLEFYLYSWNWKARCQECQLNLYVYEYIFVQGGFFYWSALKKCQTLRKFWHWHWKTVKNHPVSEFLYVSEINCIYFQGGVKCRRVSRTVICIFIQMLSPNKPRNVIESHGAEHILMNRVPEIFINRAAFSKCRGSSPVVFELRGLFVNFENIYFGWCMSPLLSFKKTKCCLTQ